MLIIISSIIFAIGLPHELFHDGFLYQSLHLFYRRNALASRGQSHLYGLSMFLQAVLIFLFLLIVPKQRKILNPGLQKVLRCTNSSKNYQAH